MILKLAAFIVVLVVLRKVMQVTANAEKAKMAQKRSNQANAQDKEQPIEAEYKIIQ